uniref:CHCH domain-containing protein n=1 Tax=Anopheles quadriannulatus TaxID=34691 RepID=A0A182X507_ANOQN
MPRRDTRARTVPPSRKSTDTKSHHGGTGKSASPPSSGSSAAEPTKPAPSAIPAAPAAPGLFSQMAATAGGVALGSVLGRALGGLFERTEPKDPQSADVLEKEKQSAVGQGAADTEKSAPPDVCNQEIKQFLTCVDREADVKICEGFKEAMQQCKNRASTKNFAL